MKFRLIYEGLLLSTQNSDFKAEHKQGLRKEFHKQLAWLWKLHPGLLRWGAAEDQFVYKDYPPMVGKLAKQYQYNGYQFVPLVTDDLSLYCSVNILMLRPDLPGTLIQSGDLDNRVKTIIDALRIPMKATELGPYKAPEAHEIPFFCLLSEDKLISRIEVTGDTLLTEARGADVNQTVLLIEVEIKPYQLGAGNAMFA